MDYTTLLLLTLTLGAGAIAKGATGMGLPLVALPPLAASVGLQQAVGIMLIPILVSNTIQIWRFRAVRGEGLAFLPRFVVGGAIGIALGTWALTSLPESGLLRGLGMILLGYIVLKLARPQTHIGLGPAKAFAPIAGVLSGTLQGATGISAPIGVTFIHAMGLVREQHVFAVSVMFLGFAVVQLPAVIIAGVYETAWLAQGLFALIPVMLFMPVGEWLARRASPALFDKLILLFLGIVGLKLVLGI